jgi:phage baseplate assembly protein W
MPIPQTVRINPLDLQGNIAIGVSLPFDGPSGPFNSTYSTQTQIKSNLLNLLLTNKGERVFNPEFGCDLERALFEGINENIVDTIKNLINTNVALFLPEIQVNDIIVDLNTPDNNTISVTINYRIRISGTADQITVQFI